MLNICFKLLEDFIEEFFYQNPISQLGMIITRNKRAEKVSDLAGNSKKHVKVIIFITLSSHPEYFALLYISLLSFIHFVGIANITANCSRR